MAPRRKPSEDDISREMEQEHVRQFEEDADELDVEIAEHSRDDEEADDEV